jgi:hypothetical protein
MNAIWTINKTGEDKAAYLKMTIIKSKFVNISHTEF